MVFCHPTSNCYHRGAKSTSGEVGGEEGVEDVLDGGKDTAGVNTADAADVSAYRCSDRPHDISHNVEDEATVLGAGNQMKNKEKVKDKEKKKKNSSFISSFIIGLSYQRGLKYVDVGPAIQVSYIL